MKFGMTSRSLSAILAVPVALISVVGASGNVVNAAAKHGASKPEPTVQVATINDYPPFEYVVKNKLTGFDIQLMKDIAQKEHFKISWEQMKFDAIIAALQTKQVDAAISAIDINPQRKQVVNFSSAYFKSGNYVFVQNKSHFHSLMQLKGQTIAALQASVGLTNAQALAKKYGTKTMIVQDVTSLFLAVKSGQAVGLIEDKAAIEYKNRTNPNGLVLRPVGKNLSPHSYGIAVTKGNSALLKKINQGLVALKKDGQFQKLYRHYFGSK